MINLPAFTVCTDHKYASQDSRLMSHVTHKTVNTKQRNSHFNCK